MAAVGAAFGLGVSEELIREGMREEGIKEENIEIIIDETEAVNHALNMAEPGDHAEHPFGP